MSIEAITSSVDVHRYSTIRLEALACDPEAFGSNVDRERAFDHDDWATRIDSFGVEPGQIFIATVDGHDIGVVGVGIRRDEAHPPEAIVWGMWVRPAGRGRGVAKELIDATVDWAASQPIDTIALSVRTGNAAAIGLYERAGFMVVDGLGLSADDPCVAELAMRRSVHRSTAFAAD